MAVTTFDLYEGAYYLLNGCELEAIEGLKLNGELTCRMSFSGVKLNSLQLTYLQGEAAANLFVFRRTYSQLASLVGKAKRKLKSELKAQIREGDET
jgi:hypothetical protein